LCAHEKHAQEKSELQSFFFRPLVSGGENGGKSVEKCSRRTDLKKETDPQEKEGKSNWHQSIVSDGGKRCRKQEIGFRIPSCCWWESGLRKPRASATAQTDQRTLPRKNLQSRPRVFAIVEEKTGAGSPISKKVVGHAEIKTKGGRRGPMRAFVQPGADSSKIKEGRGQKAVS